MTFLATPSSTTWAYWLQWKVLGCAVWVLAPIAVVCFLYRYKTAAQIHNLSSTDDETWMPFFVQLNPIWLLVYRIIAFIFFVSVLGVELAARGFGSYFFYTQWTFTLVTIYFGYACFLSAYGCHQTLKQRIPLCNDMETSVQGETQAPLVNDERVKCFPGGKRHWFLLQLLFQMSGGAVMVTDSVFWCVLYPFYTSKTFSLDFLEISFHSVNAILLLGDAALNRLPVGWFGLSYVVLWSGSYVIFQWVFHAVKAVRWPYEILDLQSPYAPLWYMAMAVGHLICYGVLMAVVKICRSILSKCFAESTR